MDHAVSIAATVESLVLRVCQHSYFIRFYRTCDVKLLETNHPKSGTAKLSAFDSWFLYTFSSIRLQIRLLTKFNTVSSVEPFIIRLFLISTIAF